MAIRFIYDAQQTITFEINDEATASELVDEFRHFMQALGYIPKNIIEALSDEADAASYEYSL